jgi:hypothetical protein
MVSKVSCQNKIIITTHLSKSHSTVYKRANFSPGTLIAFRTTNIVMIDELGTDGKQRHRIQVMTMITA